MRGEEPLRGRHSTETASSTSISRVKPGWPNKVPIGTEEHRLKLPIGFNQDARRGAVAGTAFDRNGVEHFNLASEAWVAKQGPDREKEVAEAAASLEGHQAQAVVVQRCARDEVIEKTAEVADAHGRSEEHTSEL